MVTEIENHLIKSKIYQVFKEKASKEGDIFKLYANNPFP